MRCWLTSDSTEHYLTSFGTPREALGMFRTQDWAMRCCLCLGLQSTALNLVRSCRRGTGQWSVHTRN